MFEDLVKRKFIYAQTAEIYGGLAGLYDYGPIGAGIKNNFINNWKKHFVVEENLLEISCTTLTPRVVFKNSGHEARFIDWMVKDEKTEESFRADHLIEDYVDNLLNKKKGKPSQEEAERLQKIVRSIPDFKTAEEFDKLIEEFKITNPKNKKNKLGKCYAFNLMFSCQVGPLGDQKAYLRPETAQHIFTNFQKLLVFNNGQLPFGGCMIGNAYRNEIAPRNGLLRVREFEMAEIEYFIDPKSKDHPKFHHVQDLVVPIYDRETQASSPEPRKMSLKEACEKKIIANQMLGYFLGRIYLFMKGLGINEEMIRFRQHLSGEMAHYACDCWDTELLCSYGWVECVGLADRSAFDLTAHTVGSGVKLQASRMLKEKVTKDILTYSLNRAVIGKTFKKEAKDLITAIENLTQDSLKCVQKELETKKSSKVGTFTITDEMLTDWKTVQKTF
jgi:glycyl-tRNA synthetase